MDLDKKYILLPSIFQNNFEKSQSQNDVRVIVDEVEDLKSKISENPPKSKY